MFVYFFFFFRSPARTVTHSEEPLLLVKGPDGGEAIEGFSELLVNGAFAHGIQSLQLSGCSAVHLENPRSGHHNQHSEMLRGGEGR